MAQPPNRPFESLDWYRDAARRGFADDDANRGIAGFLTGGGLLRAHISLFAVTIVALAVLNLLRSPESIWVDRVLMGWTILLLIHGVAIGAVWAVRQWNADDVDEPVRMPSNHWQQAPMFGWGAPGAAPAPAQEAQFRPAPSEPAQPPASPWADWAKVTDQPEIPESERASWSEATVTSWLERRSRQTGTAPDQDKPAE
ncbi:MAG TPA: 2TM domain-containing protein [Thermomicrobiales bacterium]|nr:2TM domain-containing protein [Thermomicrobiales bacterium]